MPSDLRHGLQTDVIELYLLKVLALAIFSVS